MVQFEEDRLGLDDVRRVEEELGLSFGPSVSLFFVRCNGGEPGDPTVRDHKGREVGNVMSVYSLQSRLFQTEIAKFRNLVRHGLVPFADNGAGDRWLVDAKTGEVRMWRHEVHFSDVLAEELPVVLADISLLSEQLTAEGVRHVTASKEANLVAFLGEEGGGLELRAFLRDNSIDVVDSDGVAIIEYAAGAGNIEVLQICLDAGAPLRRAATFAAAEGRVESLELLLKNGWDVNEKDPDGRRAIDCALESDARRFLRDRGSLPPSGIGMY